VEDRRSTREPDLNRTRRASRQRLSSQGGVLGSRQRAARLGQEDFAGRREGHAAGVTLQQLEAEFGLELGNRL